MRATVCSLLLLAACHAPGPPTIIPAPAGDTAVTGWYALAPGHRVLVSWGADGTLRLVDPGSSRLSRLHATDSPSRYLLRARGDTAGRPVTVRRGAGGAVAGLEISTPGGAVTIAGRVEGPYAQRQVRYESNGATLAGVLLVPPGAPAAAGAVIVHGSGTSSRDDAWYWTLADRMARDGIAVLFPDKRGSGQSTGDWRTASFRDLADDALAGHALLRASGAVRGGVGLVGVSQGGWIAPLAAQSEPGVAFVVNLSGAAVTPAEQVRHEIRQDLVRAGLPEPLIPEVLALQDTAAAYIRGQVPWPVYQAARERGMRAPWAQAAAGFPAEPSAWEWGWWRAVLDVDPVPLWRALGVPALVVYGEDDERDNVPVRESVRRLGEMGPRAPGAPLVVRTYAGSGHALADASGRIREDFLQYLTGWIREQARMP